MTLSINKRFAIDVDSIDLQYGKSAILRSLSVRIPRGSIFGLLGPSGCGKTSLIRCILGLVSVRHGRIRVLGHKPNCANSIIPGVGVGYMPQDISLYGDLTIHETLRYFAALYGLEKAEIEKRIQFLLNFLNLADKTGPYVGKLSGGQKRRVSLATALIHRPPLLILDEPTVGVDPLLRIAIWRYLFQLSQDDGMTILITTHYIEEAKDAHYVGLMRAGRVLQQDEPHRLMQRFGFDSLENVFLHLCTADKDQISTQIDSADELEFRYRSFDKIDISRIKIGNNNFMSNEDASNTARSNLHRKTQTISKTHTSALTHIAFIALKNLRSLWRSPGQMLFLLLLPFIEASLFALCLGGDLRSISIAVFDADQSNFSRSFRHEISSTIVDQRIAARAAAAYDDVRCGRAAAAMIIPQNFSQIFFQRISNGYASKNGTKIMLLPDMSNKLSIDFSYNEIVRAFTVTADRALVSIGADADAFDLPVTLGQPVYGKKGATFTEFMTPGIVLTQSFFAAISLTTMNLVVERNQGLVERTIVAGVSYSSIILALMATNSLIAMIQCALLLVTLFAVFGISYYGSLVLIYALTVSQSFCGMSFGLLISAISDTENNATMLSLGVFYPLIIMSGAMWPTEAMNYILRYISLALPCTIPTQSMRAIMIRSWTLDHFEVKIGFVVTFAWIIVFLLASGILLKYKK